MNVFPNLSTIASYNPLGQYITLNNYTKESFSKLGEANKDSKSAKNFSIYFHEMQHWLDHYVTLWGVKNLILTYNAFNAKTSNDEYQFKHIRTLWLEFKKEGYKDYYGVTINHIAGSFKTKWRWEYSAGYRYNVMGEIDSSKPILFIKFSSFDKKPVARVPVSVLTLLETKAMYVEITIRLSYISTLPVGQKEVEFAEFMREVEKWLYNPDFCLYNAAAHITSTIFQNEDIAQTFRASSMMSSIALNFPHSLRNKIKIPSGTKEWENRPESLLENHDLGFIFWCLNRNAAEAGLTLEKITVDEILKASGIESVGILESEISNELTQLSDTIISGIFTGASMNTIDRIRSFIKDHGIDPVIGADILQTPMAQKDHPKVVLSDSNLVYADDEAANLFISVLKKTGKLDFAPYFALTNYFEEKFEEFDSICGV